MEISKIKENAREVLKGKWGQGALIILAYFVIIFITYILGIFAIIIQVPIALGLSYTFIRLKRGEKVKIFEFLSIGFSNFGRAWRITLRILPQLILLMLCMLVGFAMLIVGPFVGLFGEPLTTVIGYFIMGMVIFVLSFIWIVSLYSLTFYVAYDNPDMTASEVLKEKARITKENKGKLFLLELSFIGWGILAAFTLGIGYIWLLPYMQVTLVCFYEDLLGNNKDNNAESNDGPIVEN